MSTGSTTNKVREERCEWCHWQGKFREEKLKEVTCPPEFWCGYHDKDLRRVSECNVTSAKIVKVRNNPRTQKSLQFFGVSCPKVEIKKRDTQAKL